MAELAISKDFLIAYARLERSVQRAVDAALGKFAEHTHAGLHLEKIKNACDSRIRTIRITDFYRGVILALGHRDYVLFAVMAHDDAIAYATNRLFTVNQVLGILEVRDQARLDEIGQAVTPPGGGFFDVVSDEEMCRLGIDPKLLPCVRSFKTEAQLEALAHVLPEMQYNVLTGLAAGMSVDEVWDELSNRVVTYVDADDLLGAARRTPESITFVSGPVELAAILAHPFDVWRTFLHPTQREVAYRESYSGPALVTGSAGTGKTVTGLHRAVFLAGRLSEGKVLITTFTRMLAETLDKQLRLLTADPAIRARIEVLSVDRLAHRIVSTRHGRKLSIADEPTQRRLWDGAGSLFSATFLRREWEQVILAQGLTNLDSYLDAPRRGRGANLHAAARRQVWDAITGVVAELAKLRQHTYLQLAGEAADIVLRAGSHEYRHLVVDEGQDLHPAQWRLLRAMTPDGPNDMFILADPYQRIYDNHVSLASLGIEVRGRSRRLTINYRTTHEILDWSVRVLTGAQPVGLDDTQDSLVGYRSVTRGQQPILVPHPNRESELNSLIERVGTWLEQGVEPHAIGVAARTNQLVGIISKALQQAHIPVANEHETGVHVTTMHMMKGLEFRCLAVAGLDAVVMPAVHAVTALADDPVSHRHDLMRERCLLFVAATRARDMLHLSHTGAPSSLLPV